MSKTINKKNVQSLEDISKGDFLIYSNGSIKALVTFVTSKLFRKFRTYDVKATNINIYNSSIISDFYYEISGKKLLLKAEPYKCFYEGSRGYKLRKRKLKKAGLI